MSNESATLLAGDTGTTTSTTTARASTQTSNVVNQTTANTGTTATTGTDTGSTTATSDPWQKDFIQSDFKLNHKALDRLPDHLKGMRPTLEKYQTFEDVLVGFQNQQVMAGKKALAPLPADAPEAVKSERKALLDTINGVPKDTKDYGFTKPQDIPDSQWNGALVDSFAKWAHQNSVSPAAANQLIKIQAEAVKGQLAGQDQYVQTFYQNEQKTFEARAKTDGINLDSANALVKKGAISLGLDLQNPQTKNFLKGADARTMAMKHALSIGEDRAITGQESGGNGGRDYKAMSDSIRSNPADPLHAPFWNKEGKYSRSDHDAAVAKFQEYLRLDSEKGAKK